MSSERHAPPLTADEAQERVQRSAELTEAGRRGHAPNRKPVAASHAHEGKAKRRGTRKPDPQPDSDSTSTSSTSSQAPAPEPEPVPWPERKKRGKGKGGKRHAEKPTDDEEVVIPELNEAQLKAESQKVRMSVDERRRVSLEYPRLSIDRPDRLSLDSRSIEGHPRRSLEMVRESQSDVGALKELMTRIEEDPSEDTWNDLRLFAEDIGPGFKLDEGLAHAVLGVLIDHAGATKSLASERLDPTSLIVLECLYTLLTKVEALQEVIERRATTQLARIKLHKHVLDEGKDHQLLALKLITFLQNSRKFNDISAYVSKVKAVRKVLDERKKEIAGVVPAASRMSVGDRVSIQAGYYDVDVDVVLSSFKTDATKGLTSDDVRMRQETFGPNALPKPKPPNKFLRDFMVIILLVAAVACFGLQEWKAAVTLIVVVIFNVTVGWVQEIKAEKALSALMSFEVPQANVIRDGTRTVVPAEELVPGDVVLLDEGDQVPADLRLVTVNDCHIIEAILTGESDPIAKNTAPVRTSNPPLGDRKNMAFMTTSVVKGNARGVVVKIGERTQAGKISASIAGAKQPKTPLQKRLDKLGKILVGVAVIFCGLIFGIGAAWGRDLYEMGKVTVSLGVSVIPEGLVAVTTVTMAIGVQRMAKRNAIVRQLAVVETLGSVSVICSDKTGTLTEGRMKATMMWAGGHEYLFLGQAYEIGGSVVEGDDSGGRALDKTSHASTTGKLLNARDLDKLDLLRQCVYTSALCNNSAFRMDPDTGAVLPIGDPTEFALLVAASRFGLSKAKITEDDGWEFEKEYAFDSNRKRMAVVYRHKGGQHVFAKGATESILSVCDKAFVTHKEEKLTKKRRKEIEKKAAGLAQQGLRVLAFATRTVSKSKMDVEKITSVEKHLTFVGLVGIMDPPRPAAKEAVRICQGAGIQVCMITGDHHYTAKAIGVELGICSEDDIPLRGADIDLLAQTDKLHLLEPFPSIFARVTPQNKLEIVEALQRRKIVCAMTGDGVNDAPAIKKADCGIAMGIAGTDITKQVASIILRDDNFATIAAAVEEGRIIYDNIQKFILYILSCNTSELLAVLVALTVNAPAPFTTMQILFGNIIADLPPAMALGVDTAEANVMQRPCRSTTEQILGLTEAFMLLSHAFSMTTLAVCVFLIHIWLLEVPVPQSRTIAWAMITVMNLFQGFLSRSKSISSFRINPLTNKWMVGGVLLSFCFLILGIYVPGVNTLFDNVYFHGHGWAWVFGGLGAHIVLTEITKALYRGHLAIFRRRQQRRKAELRANKVSLTDVMHEAERERQAKV